MQIAEIVEKVRGGVVRIEGRNRNGSGTVLVPHGVVTNAHVVEGSARVSVHFADATGATGHVIWRDRPRDLAVIRIVNRRLAAIPRGHDITLKAGTPVLALGYPLGRTLSVTQGVISSPMVELSGLTYLQVDAALNPGCSGGPLVDHGGYVLGISTMRLQEGQALNFAIPLNTVARVAEVALAQCEQPPGLHCPACGHPAADGDYCSICGAYLEIHNAPLRAEESMEALLLHDDTESRARPTRPRTAGTADALAPVRQLINSLLDGLGVDSYAARIDRNRWEFDHGTVTGEVGLSDAAGRSDEAIVYARFRIMELPLANTLPFLRKLLEYNEAFQCHPAFSIDRSNMVWLGASRPVGGMDADELEHLVTFTADLADRLDVELIADFGSGSPSHPAMATE